VREEMGINCCYTNHDKFWVQDPDGVELEIYRAAGCGIGSWGGLVSSLAGYVAAERVLGAGAGAVGGC